MMPTLTLLDDLLAEQGSMTAVARFARLHERHELPMQARYYRDLIPLEQPADGEQYAFAVDLDACTACKACVSACHSLNGLDDEEAWRDVGVLFGGTMIEPVQQTVTTACHHCADPACMNGCPVLAYEKDAVTGIVRHLDDQCIGCQYCVLKCPYDVPKYNKKRGIVRKCDMCSSRLGAGEAPACVQACPNEAIRIEVVSKAVISARVELEDALVPGAFASDYTLPSTRYRSRKPLAANMAPGNAHDLTPEHSHFPLVVMLTLTQWAAGALCADFVMRTTRMSGQAMVMCAVGLALAGLGASAFHLGRPFGAWRAFLGLRRSWLSREIVVFGLWSNLALALAGSLFVTALPPSAPIVLAGGVAATGLLGVFCSVMVYADTRRVGWGLGRTSGRFFGTTLLLGLSMVAAFAGGVALCGAVAVVALLKLAWEATFLRLGDEPALRRSALVMRGPLRNVTMARFVAGGMGVVCALAAIFFPPLAWLALGCVALGEFSERYLFFTAVTAPRMPGRIL